jgi:hypothetical protein
MARRRLDIANLIYKQAVELILILNNDAHRGFWRCAWLKVEAKAEIKRRNNSTSQIERANDSRRRKWDIVDFLLVQHILHFGDWDADALASNSCCHK